MNVADKSFQINSVFTDCEPKMEDKILNYFFEKTSDEVIKYSIYEFITQESRAKGIDCQLIDTFDLIQGNSSLKGDGPVKY